MWISPVHCPACFEEAIEVDVDKDFPTYCPACGVEIEHWDADEDDEGYLYNYFVVKEEEKE